MEVDIKLGQNLIQNWLKRKSNPHQEVSKYNHLTIVRRRNIFATQRPRIDNVYLAALCINLELCLSYERVPQLVRDTNSNRSLFSSRLFGLFGLDPGWVAWQFHSSISCL